MYNLCGDNTGKKYLADLAYLVRLQPNTALDCAAYLVISINIFQYYYAA